MKVYAVSHGSYSDYSIVALFSTRKAAEAAIASMEGDRYGDEAVEEWELYDHAQRQAEGAGIA